MATKDMRTHQVTQAPASQNEPVPYTSATVTSEQQQATISQFEIQDGPEPDRNADDDIVHPTGSKLWLSILSVVVISICFGLDLTIVAVAVPSLTNHFKSIKDIGWYASIGALVGSALNFFWARCYTIFNVKWLYIISIIIFELGSLVATVAPSSAFFILGRALTGCGGTGMKVGIFVIVTHSFPKNQRPMWNGIISMVQLLTSVAAPLVGGGLIDAFSWRACFGINLPLGAIGLASVFFGFHSPVTNPDENLPLKQKLNKLDPISTLMFVPAITCLLLALQWGGMTYGWGNARIIVLMGVFSVLFTTFGYLQFKQKENAMLPPRILKNRNVLGAAWFEACCDATLGVTEYYISIYFQGVRGFTAFKSGYLGVPMIVGLSIAVLSAGLGITYIGYYVPFMIATSILGPIASGLLTTLDLETEISKTLALLGFIGFVVGLGITVPSSVMNTVLPIKDAPIGIGVLGFAVRFSSAVFMSTSATLFQNRLTVEIKESAPSQNITILKNAGLSDIRDLIGPEKLRDVLLGYGEALSQTLYLPVALMCLSLIGTAAMEWKNIKKKND